MRNRWRLGQRSEKSVPFVALECHRRLELLLQCQLASHWVIEDNYVVMHYVLVATWHPTVWLGRRACAVSLSSRRRQVKSTAVIESKHALSKLAMLVKDWSLSCNGTEVRTSGLICATELHFSTTNQAKRRTFYTGQKKRAFIKILKFWNWQITNVCFVCFFIVRGVPWYTFKKNQLKLPFLLYKFWTIYPYKAN